MGGHPEDPLVRATRREALAVALVSAVATAFSVGYCIRFGYGRAGEPIAFVLGFPSWVFWGIVAPWLACVLVSVGFTIWFMSDQDLGEEREDTGDA